jgi:hypothetical protein
MPIQPGGATCAHGSIPETLFWYRNTIEDLIWFNLRAAAGGRRP